MFDHGREKSVNSLVCMAAHKKAVSPAFSGYICVAGALRGVDGIIGRCVHLPVHVGMAG
jgi:hypothetical protein